MTERDRRKTERMSDCDKNATWTSSTCKRRRTTKDVNIVGRRGITSRGKRGRRAPRVKAGDLWKLNRPIRFEVSTFLNLLSHALQSNSLLPLWSGLGCRSPPLALPFISILFSHETTTTVRQSLIFFSGF